MNESQQPKVDKSRRFKRFGDHYIDTSKITNVYLDNKDGMIIMYYDDKGGQTMQLNEEDGQQFLAWLKENTEE